MIAALEQLRLMAEQSVSPQRRLPSVLASLVQITEVSKFASYVSTYMNQHNKGLKHKKVQQ